MKMNRALVAFLILPLAGCFPATPMIKAVASGHDASVRSLIDQGEKVEQVGQFVGMKSKQFGTPLMQAAVQGRLATAILLLERGAKVNTHGGGQFSPLILAASNGHKDVVELLLDNGADPKMTVAGLPFNKFTPRRYAEQTGHTEIARLLSDAENGKLPGRFVKGPDGKIRDRKQSGEAARAEADAILQPVLPTIEEAEKAGDAAAASGRPQEALKAYVDALRAVPAGAGADPRIQRLREKIIRYAATSDPPPGIPEEARDHAMKGQAYVKMAKGPEDYNNAAREFLQVIDMAPWWADAYYNFGVVQEKLGAYDSAARLMRWYLLAAPEAPDAGKVRRKIAELEVMQEQAGRAR